MIRQLKELGNVLNKKQRNKKTLPTYLTFELIIYQLTSQVVEGISKNVKS